MKACIITREGRSAAASVCMRQIYNALRQYITGGLLFRVSFIKRPSQLLHGSAAEIGGSIWRRLPGRTEAYARALRACVCLCQALCLLHMCSLPPSWLQIRLHEAQCCCPAFLQVRSDDRGIPHVTLEGPKPSLADSSPACLLLPGVWIPCTQDTFLIRSQQGLLEERSRERPHVITVPRLRLIDTRCPVKHAAPRREELCCIPAAVRELGPWCALPSCCRWRLGRSSAAVARLPGQLCEGTLGPT